MRKISIIVFTVVLIALVCTVVPGIRVYADRRNCVCSMLTTTEGTFTIDDRLYRVVERDTMKSGVFMTVRTTCDHGKRLLLIVYPDEGLFKGSVIAE